MTIVERVFGNYHGEAIKLYTLYNAKGMRFSCTPYGAIITELYLPSDVYPQNLVLGLETLEAYLSDDYRQEYPYLGAVIGRNAGRIKNGEITIDGQRYQLTNNYPTFQLHGGIIGFDSKVWEVVSLSDGAEPSILLSYVSVDGEEGYPGEVTTFVRYTLTADGALAIQMEATTKATTIINLTQHTYFNFNYSEPSLNNHHLQVHADRYLACDEKLMPTGTVSSVQNSDYDYRVPRQVQPQLDCSFVNQQKHTASLTNIDNGIKMDVFTNRPITHIYTGEGLRPMSSNHYRAIGPFGGICFETQGYSDAPNQPDFPTTLIRPGEKFLLETKFKFTY